MTKQTNWEREVDEIIQKVFRAGVGFERGESAFEHGHLKMTPQKAFEEITKATLAVVPEKLDLSTFEPDEDGGLNIKIDEKNESVTGENLVFLAKYAESKGFNDAIDEILDALGVKDG